MEKIYENKDRDKLIEDIKQLPNYEGYIQFSDTKIRDCDIFKKEDHISQKLQLTNGFIYEAHFYNGQESIMIRQINDSWIVSKTDISNVENSDIEAYISDIKDCPKIKMAQIWEEEADEFCKGMMVKKLKKVVFSGFEDGK